MKLHIASLLLFAPALIGQCTIGTPGVQEANPPGCGWIGATIPLGFTFPFNGTTYTDFAYTDHGLISLHNGTVPAIPPGGVQVYTPGSGGLAGFGADVICCYWTDHVVGGGSIWIDNTSGTHMTITWADCEPFGGSQAIAFTAQLTLYDNGNITICLDDRCNNTSSTFGPVECVIGVNVAGNPLPPSSDFSTNMTSVVDPTVYEEFIGPGPGGPNTPDPNFDLGNSTISFFPTVPGWVVIVEPLICAGTSSIGTGCAGLSLASLTSPVLGATWDLELSGVTAPGPLASFVVFGGSTPPAPVGVLFPGLFGATCNAYVDNSLGIVDAGIANAMGETTLQLPIPLNASFKGLTLTGQGLAFDFTGPDIFALSSAETGTLGY